MKDDLINRQAAINAIENTECELLAEEWDELTNAIKQVPSAQQWIPVTERLPEKHQYVLVTYNGLDGRRLVVVTNWNPNTWIESNSVAWMPVPEPYEGRQK